MNIGQEDEQIEFKKSTGEIKAACQSIVAILNKHQSGTLYFGVLDNGEVVGQQISNSTNKNIVNTINQSIDPNPYYELNVLNSNDNKNFIEIIFKGKNVPYTCNSVFYIRNGDSDNKMDRNMVKEYFQRYIESYENWESSNSKVAIDNVNDKTWINVFGKINNKILKKDNTDIYKYLKKLNLIYKDNRNFNNAGYVLFSNTKPVLIKLVSYNTNTRISVIDMKQFRGNIFECINEAMEFVNKNISWVIKFTGNLQREEIPEIPLEAIREIIINAFAHGKYESNTSFAIEIFSDRISIYSPGAFPVGVIPEDFAYKSHEPIMLNPRIVNVLYKSGYIETLASGFERTFEYCKNAGIKYKYYILPEGFRFVFLRNNQDHNVVKLNVRQKHILKYLKDDNKLTFNKLSEQFEVDKKTISRDISKLKSLGMLKREGSNRNGSWIVVDDYNTNPS